MSEHIRKNAVDNDAAGIGAAEECAHRLAGAAIEVVTTQTRSVNDFNDKITGVRSCRPAVLAVRVHARHPAGIGAFPEAGTFCGGVWCSPTSLIRGCRFRPVAGLVLTIVV
jgi:hypothetical protein